MRFAILMLLPVFFALLLSGCMLQPQQQSQVSAPGTGQEQPPGQMKSCSDGTAEGECSVNRPYYCYGETLVQAPNRCGCPQGQEADSGTCRKKTCADGTLVGECSSQKPKYCTEDGFADDAKRCGCPQGQAAYGSQCKGQQAQVKKCTDGTIYGECSLQKPYYCSNTGTLSADASRCGCPEGYENEGTLCKPTIAPGTQAGRFSLQLDDITVAGNDELRGFFIITKPDGTVEHAALAIGGSKSLPDGKVLTLKKIALGQYLNAKWVLISTGRTEQMLSVGQNAQVGSVRVMLGDILVKPESMQATFDVLGSGGIAQMQKTIKKGGALAYAGKHYTLDDIYAGATLSVSAAEFSNENERVMLSVGDTTNDGLLRLSGISRIDPTIIYGTGLRHACFSLMNESGEMAQFALKPGEIVKLPNGFAGMVTEATPSPTYGVFYAAIDFYTKQVRMSNGQSLCQDLRVVTQRGEC